MPVTISGSGPITGSDRAESGVNDDITSLGALASMNGGQLAGLRNRIINGGMDIAQRGTSFAAIASGAYSLDRWLFSNTSAAVGTVSQQPDVPSDNEFQSSLRFAVTTADASIAAGDVALINQYIEGYNVRDLIGRPLTLSFRVRSSKTGVHCVSFGNSNTDRTFVSEYTVNAVNTWETKTITVSAGLITAGTWNWTNGLGLQVRFALAAGPTFQTTAGAWQTGNFLATANQVNCLDTVGNIFAITGVQLELGSVATPFEHRPYGMELALCQRYYLKSYNIDVAPGSALLSGVKSGVAVDTERIFLSMCFPVSMRSTPSITLYGENGASGVWTAIGGVNTASASNEGISTSGFLSVTSAGLTKGNGYYGHFVASAEL